MFGIGKKKAKEQPSGNAPAPATVPTAPHQSYTEAWGAYAAAARFRGILALVSSATALFAILALVVVASLSRPIVVGIDPSGRPEVMKAAETVVSREIFVKDFVDAVWNYNAMNIEDKAVRMPAMMTDIMYKAWISKLGEDWIRLVRGRDVMQVTSIQKVSIVQQSTAGFTAEVQVQMVRTEQGASFVSNREGKITIKVVKGAIDSRNAFGLYVDGITDETRESRR